MWVSLWALRVICDLYAHKDLIFMYKYKKFESLRLRHYLLIYGWISCDAAVLGCHLMPLVSASHCCEQGGLALTGLEV